MNATAAAQLYSRPHIRRGVDYGFDADEAARIRAEFPQVEIVFDIARWRMQVWAIGKYGATPHCLYPSLPGCQQFKLLDMLRAGKYEAANYRAGEYDPAIRAEIAARDQAEVRETVDALDPDRIGTEVLDRRGRVRPVSMVGAL